jgi:hypothetical protein
MKISNIDSLSLRQGFSLRPCIFRNYPKGLMRQFIWGSSAKEQEKETRKHATRKIVNPHPGVCYPALWEQEKVIPLG